MDARGYSVKISVTSSFLLQTKSFSFQKLLFVFLCFGLLAHHQVIATDSSDSTSAVPTSNSDSDVSTHDAVEASELKVSYDSDLYVSTDAEESEPKKPEHLASSKDETQLSFDKLYMEGVKAYDDGLWYSCATRIESAIKDYRTYKKTLTDCRLGCANGSKTSKLSSISSFTRFADFSKFLESADCFRRCRDDSLAVRPRVTERLEKAFEKRTPYQYLQFCFFKLDRLPKAASAAYTYFLKNQEDPDTRQNMLFYRDKAGVPEKHFLDMEMVTYKEEYIRAMMAHKAELWTGVIRHLEMCVEDYFVQDERCQADCQGKTRMRGTEFSTGIADLIIDILTCRLNCEEQLSAVYSEPIDFFLQDIFHYLNFAYYKVGDYEKSAEAIASCLQLNGSHQVMKDNKEVLKKKIDYADEDFVARESVVEYAAQKREMQDLMDFINKNYKWPDINENVEDEEEDEDILQQDNVESDDWMTRYEKLGMHIIAKAEDLSRAQRFVTDGLLKPEQCEELLMLVEGIPVKASGALTFTLKLAQERLERSPDEEYEASLRLFIRAAEAIRHYTQRYTEAPDAYYLKHTSVVCWSQPSELKEKLDCYRQEHGSCVRFDDMSDELYVDAFTTVTYLNTADEDGDFVFLGENRGVDNSFGVKCGRTVGFNSGDRHTLKIPKGNSQRCAMVIDYTIYRSDDEKEYQDTLSLLHRVDELRLASAQKSSEVVMKAFDDKGVKIVKKSDDLQGKERFVADGLATDAQCNTLRNMVLEMGKAGDGYEGQKSPHTINEMFAGLSLVQVAQLMHMGMISTFGLRAFLELSEDARLLVEKYFNLTKPLYFDYTHLVCRTAIDDSKSQRQDLSHPVHADNCLLQPDGSCTKDYPAFTQRDYSAILYLNADFEGGEFFFAHSNKSEQVSLRPKCGRLVGFNAGEFHGVRAVKSGQRCALALWFTHNPNFKELAHIQARKTLKQVEKDQQSEEKIVHEDL